MSPPPQNKRWRLPSRWKRLIILLLVSIFLHPATSVYAQDSFTLSNRATAAYSTPQGEISIISNQVDTAVTENELIDPAGDILGCDGQPLDSYAGFSVLLYEPDASGLDLGELVALTPTSGVDSIAPNTGNINPFALPASEGRYNFLFDDSRLLSGAINAGLTQTEAGARYILVIKPPAESNYGERRVLITMLDSVTDASNISTLSYRATSLDNSPDRKAREIARKAIQA